MTTRLPNYPTILALLEAIPDPEIPAISIVELGMVRRVEALDPGARVTITPTYAACPALHVIRREIIDKLGQAGVAPVEVAIQHAPPWTSDDISPQGRRKLLEFGLAPPAKVCAAHPSADPLAEVACPHCGSADTRLANRFGSTLCRALFVCNACRQPFEGFKPL